MHWAGHWALRIFAQLSLTILATTLPIASTQSKILRYIKGLTFSRDNIWVPAALERINGMVTGNLTFSETDILFLPYLCAYESQITGGLSPWCGVFTDDELKSYEYSQDLSYFYGDEPGSSGPAQKVFLPFLDRLMSLLMEGPGQQGKGLNCSTFTVPNLIMSFLNDGQISELTAAMGIFDAEGNFP